MNWSRPDLPQAAVVFRGYSVHFGTWVEAIEYATRFARRVAEVEAKAVAQ
ncbi:hypothetical protein [Cellulomonas shaoxiangyii]|nr:hypothetical protein [Cellulomonas shaoxiangyii]